MLRFAYNPASQIVSNTRSNDHCRWTQDGSGTASTSADGLDRIASRTRPWATKPKGTFPAIGSSAGYSQPKMVQPTDPRLYRLPNICTDGWQAASLLKYPEEQRFGTWPK